MFFHKCKGINSKLKALSFGLFLEILKMGLGAFFTKTSINISYKTAREKSAEFFNNLILCDISPVNRPMPTYLKKINITNRCISGAR